MFETLYMNVRIKKYTWLEVTVPDAVVRLLKHQDSVLVYQPATYNIIFSYFISVFVCTYFFTASGRRNRAMHRYY